MATLSKCCIVSRCCQKEEAGANLRHPAFLERLCNRLRSGTDNSILHEPDFLRTMKQMEARSTNQVSDK